MLRFHNNSDSRQTQSASTIRIALLTANSYTNSLRTRKDSENCCLHFLILPLRGLFAFPLVQLNARSLFVTIKIIGKFSLALRDFLNITQFVTSVVRTTPAFGIQSIRPMFAPTQVAIENNWLRPQYILSSSCIRLSARLLNNNGLKFYAYTFVIYLIHTQCTRTRTQHGGWKWEREKAHIGGLNCFWFDFIKTRKKTGKNENKGNWKRVAWIKCGKFTTSILFKTDERATRGNNSINPVENLESQTVAGALAPKHTPNAHISMYTPGTLSNFVKFNRKLHRLECGVYCNCAMPNECAYLFLVLSCSVVVLLSVWQNAEHQPEWTNCDKSWCGPGTNRM